MRTLVLLLSLALSTSVFANEPKEAGVDPSKALTWLMNGNTRFNRSFLRKDGQSKKDVERLSSGQQPHAIVLSCSDSRVPPEIVFDQKLGEIFTVRTAGQALDDNAVGSIEYAIEHLGAKLIVVMGHTACGAVKAAFGTLDGSSAGTPALDALVKDIHPRIAAFKDKKPSENFHQESWANAEGVARDLIRRSSLIGGKWEKGQIWIVPSLYNLGTGKVAFGDNLKMESRRTPTAEPPPEALTPEPIESRPAAKKVPSLKFDRLDPPDEYPY